MKINRNINRGLAVFVLVVMMGITPLATAQSVRIAGGSVSQTKFGFYWETHLEPPTPPMSGFSTSATDEPGIIHRFLVDRQRQIFLGYDALIEVLPEPDTYRVTFRKLTTTGALAQQFGGVQWSQRATPGWGDAPKVIHGGDVLSITLLVNGATNQRIMDYVTVQEPSRRFSGFNTPVPERQFSFVPGPSRDFGADDVELMLQSPRLSVNGKLDETSTRLIEKVSGSIVWIYVAKRGRFLLSLVPHADLGFRKAGEVRGSSLSFVVAGDAFVLNTGDRIAPGQAPFSLYVRHEPDWKPTYAFADASLFTVGKAERSEFARRK
jgi:hypothetical protein